MNLVTSLPLLSLPEQRFSSIKDTYTIHYIPTDLEIQASWVRIPLAPHMPHLTDRSSQVFPNSSDG